jgi:iron complex transport system substrate-binding protein
MKPQFGARTILGLPIFIVLIGFNSCINKAEKTNDIEHTQIVYSPFEIKYAQGFKQVEIGKNRCILILDPQENVVLDTLFLGMTQQDSIAIFSKLVLQSTTHFSFVHKLKMTSKIVGICGKRYLNDLQLNKAKHVSEICNTQEMLFEKILQLQPDLVLVYPFGKNDHDKLKSAAVNTLYITEYLETSPLARSEWMKFFALITGLNPNHTAFEKIETSYLSLKSKNRGITAAFNLPFGDSWDMPSDNSISAMLIRDAGFDYQAPKKNASGNQVLKHEEAYAILEKTDFWIIIAERQSGFDLDKLVAENRIYGSFPSVRNKRVIFCNTATSPYFSEGPIEPHILLQDLLNCIEGEDEDNKYFKLLR